MLENFALGRRLLGQITIFRKASIVRRVLLLLVNYHGMLRVSMRSGGGKPPLPSSLPPPPLQVGMLVRYGYRMLLLFALGGLLMLAACSSVSTTSPATLQLNHNHVIDASLLQGSGVGDWPMFGYDPGHTGFVDSVANPHVIQGKLLWSQHLGPIFSSPVGGLNMLYIASTSGYLYALKQSSGAVVWRSQVGNYLTDATPALEGKVLFVSVHSSALEALDALSGRVYWTFETAEKIQAPPLVVGSRVLVASRMTLWALDAASGRLLWKFHQGADGWPTTGSPTLAGNSVYMGLGTGTQLWAINVVNGRVLWSFDTHDRITGEALVEDEMVYIATWHGSIFALDRNRGTRRWVYSLNRVRNQNVVDGVGGSMALANGRLYVGDYRGLILCIDAVHGKVIWSFATGAQILGTPVVTSGQVYVGSDDGYFYALDTRTGRPVWRYSTGEVRSSASLANGHLYVGGLNGVVYAFV